MRFFILLTFFLIEYASALTLGEAVRQGIKNDYSLKALVYDYELAMRDRELVDAAFRPTLDLTGFIGREYTKTPASEGSKTLTAKSISLVAKYNLFSGYKKKFMEMEKEATINLADSKLREGIINSAKEITRIYLDVLKKYKIYVKYKESIKNYKNTLNKVSLKIKDGGGRDSDLYQVRSRMNYEQSNLIAAHQAYEDARIELSKYIGYIPDGSKMLEPRIKTKGLTMNSIVARAKKHNIVLNNLRIQQKIAESYIGQEKSKLYPTIDLEASRTWTEGLHGIEGEDESYNIMVKAKYNIYNGHADEISIEKAKIQHLKSAAIMKNARREIVSIVKRTYKRFALERDRVASMTKHIKNAKKTENLYLKEEEETGERSIIDILNIQQEYNSAEISRIDAKYNMIQLYYDMLSHTSEIIRHFGISKYNK